MRYGFLFAAMIAAYFALGYQSIAAAQGLLPSKNRQQLTPEEYREKFGPCACPDDQDIRGRRCGKRSGYCRNKAAEPICFPHDVTMRQIRQRNRREC
jgi:hypothetical protein